MAIFKNNKIKYNGQWYAKGTKEYNVFLEKNKNEENIKKEIEKALSNGKIPSGATLTPA